jgi:hypothetical protein
MEIAATTTVASATDMIKHSGWSEADANNMSAWLAKCPDAAKMMQLVRIVQFFSSKGSCYECGNSFEQTELRWNCVGPYGSGDELICENCWRMWDSETISGESHKKPWPASLFEQHLNPDPKFTLPVNGILVDRDDPAKTPIGRVEGYIRSDHTAAKVTRIGFENCSEGGTLCPEDEVIATELTNAAQNGNFFERILEYLRRKRGEE